MQGVSSEAFDLGLSRCGLTDLPVGTSIAVGISGGRDSMALTLLLNRWAKDHSVRLRAVTVDHGLRAASPYEAQQVSHWLKGRGIEHTVLTWDGEKPSTSIQKIARLARFDLMTGWCRDHGISHLFLAHNAEDQAETLLQRIGKDSGLDGLSGMRARTVRRGVNICRPLLSVPRRELEAVCRAEGQGWIDDPSNQDRQYERVRLRGLLPELDGAGLSVSQLGRYAAAMGSARDWLDQEVDRVFAAMTTLSPHGFACFNLEEFLAQDQFLASRFLGRITTVLGGREYPVRGARLKRLADEMFGPGLTAGRTLGGCIVKPDGASVLVMREWEGCEAPKPLVPGGWQRWDNRFEIRSPVNGEERLQVSALGPEGWRQLLQDFPEWAARAKVLKIPYEARLALPKVTRISKDGDAGLDALVSVPHLISRNDERGLAENNRFEVEFIGGYRLFTRDSH